MKYSLSLLFTCFFLYTFAQQPPATPAADRLAGKQQRASLQENSLVDQLPFRSAGPTVFSGRVVDIDANPLDPSIFYTAYASGGLWKTENNGTTFSPLFDQEEVMTIGDIAVNWEKNILWLGTGENNSSRSSYSGVGMYKSEDGGASWQHKGLPESHHIGRIILHPVDSATLWVAALGHLYSPNEERGIYKSSDGGDSWQKTLFVDANTGAVDLIIDPADPDILYAATWHRERRAWNFVESGEGSGIYKSVDGGESWTLLTSEKSGFPSGEGVGRIGLAIAKENGKSVLYASLDNYFRRAEEKKEKSEALTKENFRAMTADEFADLEKKDLAEFLKANRFPKKYTAEGVKKMVKKKKVIPNDLTAYLENANSLLFDTPVIGAEVYRSVDEGKSWEKTHEGYLDGLFYSYGYYFGQIRVSPHDPQKIYILGVPVLRSDDGGATFKSINGDNVHVDHHALWLSPLRKEHLILGNDGGVNISYDDGEHWIKCNSPAVGQFYTLAVDHAKPYNIYGGLQDNGVWMGPNNYKANTRWHSSGQYPYHSILGGDGMQIAIDTRNNNTVYTGFQFGFYFRIDLAKKDYQRITPMHELGEAPLRWNWQTPIHLSIHNQDILYMGSHKVHRSMKQGDDFKVISDDLTNGGIKGDIPYGTLTTLHESPLRFGLLYAGSDDGLIHVSKDGGVHWEKITEGLPEKMWVTKVQASAFEEGRVYASLNGYRWDDFNAYVYRSDDYGKTWIPIATTLPPEPVNVIKEDPVNENLLYIGTDHGLYISLDRGATVMHLGGSLPAASVHDLVVHPLNHDLVVATHARSFYIGNVAILQKLTEEVMDKTLYTFPLESITYRKNWGERSSKWKEPSEAKLQIPVFVKEKGKLKLKVKTEKGLLLKIIEVAVSPGLNYVDYNLEIDNLAAQKLERFLNKGKKEEGKTIEIKEKDNGKYYLYEGGYVVEFGVDGGIGEEVLEIKDK